MTNSSTGGLTIILYIMIAIMFCLLIVLALVYINMKLKTKKPEDDQIEMQKAKANSAKKIKNFTISSIFDFMEFDKIEDNMIIQKKGNRYVMVIDCQGINYDLMSQAEHDKLASSILVTTSKQLYEEVEKELEKQIKKLERKEIIEESLTNHGKVIICETIDECIEVSNMIAPEHLELMVENSMEQLGKVKHAGSVFLGYNTPEPIGDYFGGTNHVLPTNGSARFFSALSVDSFIKKSSFLYYSKEAILEDGEKIINIANKEGLTAHANSVKVRLK